MIFNSGNFVFLDLIAIWLFSNAQGPHKSWLHLVMVRGLNLIASSC